MPGFTHLQVAQPVTFGHHLLAYDAMLARDAERLVDCRRRVNRLPLGSAALAGTSFPIDRDRVARELGFEGLCANSLDAVSDRDFAIEFAAAGALLMMHLSRFAEELVLWSSPRFGFVRLADRFCTGSSIMPQKKNPDVPELVRGKTGRVYGDLVALLTADEGAAARLQQGQPGGQGAGVRPRRHAAADARHHRRAGIRRHRGRCRTHARGGERGLRDRDRSCRLPGEKGTCRFATRTRRSRRRCATPNPSSAIWPRCRSPSLQRFSPLIEDDVYAVLTLEGSVASRNHPGGTAPAQVRAAIRAARPSLAPGRRASGDAIGPRHAPSQPARSSDGQRQTGVPRPGRHGLSDGRTPGACRTCGRRLQPHARQGRAVGRKVRRQLRRRRRPLRRPMRRW